MKLLFDWHVKLQGQGKVHVNAWFAILSEGGGKFLMRIAREESARQFRLLEGTRVRWGGFLGMSKSFLGGWWDRQKNTNWIWTAFAQSHVHSCDDNLCDVLNSQCKLTRCPRCRESVCLCFVQCGNCTRYVCVNICFFTIVYKYCPSAMVSKKTRSSFSVLVLLSNELVCWGGGERKLRRTRIVKDHFDFLCCW